MFRKNPHVASSGNSRMKQTTLDNIADSFNPSPSAHQTLEVELRLGEMRRLGANGKGCFSPHCRVGFLVFCCTSSLLLLLLRLPPSSSSLTQIISHNNISHTTSLTQHPTHNISHTTSLTTTSHTHTQHHSRNIPHTTSRTQHHSHNISHNNISHTTSLTQHPTHNISHNISHTTSRTQHHSRNISHNNISHTTSLTQHPTHNISHNISHTTSLTQHLQQHNISHVAFVCCVRRLLLAKGSDVRPGVGWAPALCR